jgi:hypothetical protein
MTTEDPRIVLRGSQIGLADDPIVDHPGQPAHYVHTDGTVWTWQQRWRVVGGVPVHNELGTTGGAHLRLYDLVQGQDRTPDDP